MRLEPYLKGSRLSETDLENMLHWLEQYKKPEFIQTFSVDKVYHSTQKWLAKLIESGKEVIEEAGDVKVVKELNDGFYLVKLVKESAFKYEGTQMGHCASSYSNSSSDLYSIRDSHNKPHCTIEVKDGQICQIKGKQNSFVVSKYVPYVFEALAYLNLSVNSSDLKNLGLLKVSDDELEALEKVLGKTPVSIIGGDKYLNNSDSFWKNVR